ncbi:ABC transporter permease [Pelagicoccus mobilis]|uniref:ABC transporter permease n=1 Tax=Pelagicoccus mobilis TaxID=415221 RepID=A0A934RVH0_9BACT|nr:ABC transporter permease [Pelagicoccus mobilis]MBK1875566.1 ABC transporter permease [Pelagicoccus mobilis]
MKKPTQNSPFALSSLKEYASMLAIWIGLIILFSLLSDRFFSAATFSSLANQIPALTLVAAGMTLVIITAGIDLSVGSILGLAGSVFGISLLGWGLPLPLAVILALVAGSLAGWVNGWISVSWRVPSFIVTLGMLEIARGLSYLATDSQTMYLNGALGSLSRPIAGIGIPVTFIVAIIIVILLQFILSRTVFGRRLIAIGTNEQAVTLAGIRTQGPRVAVFAIAGFLAAIGGLFYTSRLGSADPNAGVGLELSAIAAVVIGGTSLMGGRGSVINTFFGVLIIATLESGLAQLGASEPVKRVITGAVIVGAASLDAWRNQLQGGALGFLKKLVQR